MDPLGRNKIMAAILGAALVFMMIRTVPEFLMHHDYPEVPAYFIGEVPSADDGEEIELPFPQITWVEAMDAEAGARVFKKCTSCHNAEPGGANGTGPALYGVVGNVMGTHEGFAYSSAMASSEQVWDYAALDAFLERPSAYLSGTKMNFIGLRKPEDRAAVIEYLRVADANPEPLPEPAPGPEELLAETQPDDAVIPAEEQAMENPLNDVTDEETAVDEINRADTDPAEVLDGEDDAEVLTPEKQEELE